MKLDHIGIAVQDLDEARKFYGELLGFVVSEPEELAERGLRICFVDLGGGKGAANLELLFPTEAGSAVAKFLEKRGPGIHHLCYQVDDVAGKLSGMKQAGVKLIDEHPRPGAHGTLVAFIHPTSAGGVLTELCQKK